MLGVMLLIAMQTSSTNCYPTGLGNVQCDTRQTSPAPSQPAPGYNAMQGLQAFEMGRAARRQEDAESREPTSYSSPTRAMPGRSEVTHSIFVQVLAEKMDFHIRNGRCQEAYLLAMLAEEYAMGAESRRMCPFQESR